MTLRVAGLVTLVACTIGMSACSSTPAQPDPPVTGTVDRVSSFGPSNSTMGVTYFTFEGDINKSYSCYYERDRSCSTLTKGDKITITLTEGSDWKLTVVKTLKHIN